MPEQIDIAHMHHRAKPRRTAHASTGAARTRDRRAQYVARIEEPLALTMKRYAEFLGPDNLDYVVSQALQFMFKRDSVSG